jgi:hypothetical protein
MATNYLVLGQVAPNVDTLATLYVCPSDTQAVVSTISACNTNPSETCLVRLAVRPGSASIATQHYIIYDVSLEPNESLTLTLGITLGESDVVSVQSSASATAFSAFGSEISLGS